MLQAPAEDRSLWLVARLDPDPSRSRFRALYYAKARIPADTGPYRWVEPANVQSGVRTGAWSIVSADPAATMKLEENQRADDLGDTGYDSARTSRQGSDVLAEAATQEQRC